jgi:hypothetical protein
MDLCREIRQTTTPRLRSGREALGNANVVRISGAESIVTN